MSGKLFGRRPKSGEISRCLDAVACFELIKPSREAVVPSGGAGGELLPARRSERQVMVILATDTFFPEYQTLVVPSSLCPPQTSRAPSALLCPPDAQQAEVSHGSPLGQPKIPPSLRDVWEDT